MDKVVVFKKLLDEFETEHMKSYCEDMIEFIPDYIFDMPSSTSGKYHNKTQCLPHGQIYHIIMFGVIMNYRLALKGNKEKFKSPEQRDAMRCVPIFHDALKCGTNGSKFTVHDHPIFAHDWVLNTKVEHDVPDKVKEVIADMCAAHSGEWTTSKKSKVVLPEPKNAMEMFCHECDILSSRSDIDMQPPEYLKEIFGETEPVELPDISTYIVTFGKMSGNTIPEIYEKAPDYLSWMKQNITRSPVKKLIEQFYNEKEKK